MGGRLMKRVFVAIAIAFLILAFTATAALAQGGPSGQALGCCGSSCQDCRPHGADYYGRSNCEGCRPDQDRRYEEGNSEVRMHNPAVPETISGAVIDVYQTLSKLGQGAGLHLLLKTDGGMLDVHLGPEWWLDKQNFSIEPGDSLEIKGARFTRPVRKFGSLAQYGLQGISTSSAFNDGMGV